MRRSALYAIFFVFCWNFASDALAQSATAASGSQLTGPLILAKQGSFFINQESVETSFPTVARTIPTGHVSARGMYVQYQIPQNRDPNASAIILVHGSTHSGKTYEETPDGRMGWAEYFVRRGMPVYVVDHAGRARSGFDPSPSNRAKAHDSASLVPTFRKFTNEQAWVNFRIGAKAFTPFENSQFPVDSAEQYFAQMLPNTETSYADSGMTTVRALAKLIDRVGPAIIVVHSQSGPYGIAVAEARPALVRALVAVEPVNCVVSDSAASRVFRRVPFLALFGDFQTGSPAWQGHMTNCINSASSIQAAGGTAENIYLPDRGIRGNSHMLMMDRNNLAIADLIITWLGQDRPRR